MIERKLKVTLPRDERRLSHCILSMQNCRSGYAAEMVSHDEAHTAYFKDKCMNSVFLIEMDKDLFLRRFITHLKFFCTEDFTGQ